MNKIYTYGFDLFDIECVLFFQDYRYQAERYFQYDSINGMQEIPKEHFLTKKFGKDFDLIIPYLEGQAESVVRHNNTIITCGFKNFYFQWFDKNGILIQKREDIGFDNIYDFDVDTDTNIWYVIPTHDHVGVFSLTQNKELNLLKDLNDSKYFSMPESIKIYDGCLYISDMGNNRIVKIPLKTFIPETYKNFYEPISEYIQLPNQQEFFVLDSGLYIDKVTSS